MGKRGKAVGSRVYGLVTCAYREERFIQPFLKHLPDWIDDKLVLNSSKPWFGTHRPVYDNTADLAKPFATVIRNHWTSEADQRNTGLDLNQDKDWVIILDPDEFFDEENWAKLKEFLDTTDAEAVVVEKQRVFWKNKEVSPCNDYQQLIAVRPHINFVDKRIVGIPYVEAPVTLLHFSWARTNEEVYEKITHYAHANDFNTSEWYEDVWLADKKENMHPTTPETLGGLIEPVLPPEIEKLGLFP